MKKIKSYSKFVKSKFNPKPSKKTYGWMPDPKTKVTKVKEELDLRKALTGAALGTTLAFGQPQTNTIPNAPIEQSTKFELDAQKTVEKVREISVVRKSKSDDDVLDKILFEIETNIGNKDSAKLVELSHKLMEHIDENYGYKVPQHKVEELSISSLEEKCKSMTIFEILGWLGSICLAICGLPQAWQSYKDKHSEGISWGFILLWTFGEIFALAYVYDKLDLPLLLNYGTNILILGVILYYKINPTNDGNKEI
jgi:uncharacterized protein with PQ loop repeat